MGIGDNTLTHIRQSGDEDTLNRIRDFTYTGDQDESNDRARAAIEARRKELQNATAANQMATQASSYRSKLPEQQEKLYSSVAGQARRSLAEQLGGVRSGYNRRGLLYSGLRQGAEADLRGQTAAGLAQARQSINDQTEKQARTMEENVGRAATGSQLESLAQEDMIMQQAMQNVMSRLQMWSGIGQAAGTLGGQALAKKPDEGLKLGKSIKTTEF